MSADVRATSSGADPTTSAEAPAARSGDRAGAVLGWLGTFLGLSLLVGFLSGLFWWLVVDLPTYTVRDDFSAVTTERGLTEYFATDAWFSGLGLLVGAGIGIVAWRWFSSLGWPVAVIASLGGLAAGSVCWLTGDLFGPGPFDVRLTAASPGDVVPIEFQLHAPIALLVWVFGAVIPILLRSSLGPDAADPAPPKVRRLPAPVTVDTPETVGHDIAPLPSPSQAPRKGLGLTFPTRRPRR